MSIEIVLTINNYGARPSSTGYLLIENLQIMLRIILITFFAGCINASVYSQIDVCRFLENANHLGMPDLTKIKLVKKNWYIPFNNAKDSLPRWTILRVNPKGKVEDADTSNFIYILDYTVNKNSISILGKANSRKADSIKSQSITLTVSNDSVSFEKPLIPHYYIFDRRGYLGITDLAGYKKYITPTLDSLEIFGEDGSSFDKVEIRKLFPIALNGFSKMMDTLGNFSLLHLDTTQKRMVEIKDYKQLPQLVLNANGTIFLQNNSNKALLLRPQYQDVNNITKLEFQSVTTNFSDKQDYAVGKSDDGHWYLVDSLLRKDTIDVVSDSCKKVIFFSDGNHPIKIDAENQNADSSNARKNIKLFIKTLKSFTNVTTIKSSIRPEPLFTYPNRYYFYTKKNNEINFFFCSKGDTVLKKVKGFDGSVTGSATISPVDVKSTDKTYLVADASRVYFLRFPSINPGSVQAILLTDIVVKWFLTGNNRILVTKVIKNNDSFEWQAYDLLQSNWKEKKLTPLNTKHYKSIYWFISRNKISSICKSGFYYSAIETDSDNEQVEIYTPPMP